ncbi:MAG: large-conductance mechanosensitive channel protein MscL [Sedimentisphaerales bacterium]|nr:large-conductance mechanosensitive channel protein MscL [Sedimentisphaerales bacterium]
MGMLKEFKDFALRGNVVDMAVGIIIGGAFGKIVTSVVNDIVMPPIGMLIGGVDFADLKWELKEAVGNAAGEVITPAVTINYGMFINVVINFLIIAWAIFIVIKALNSFKKKQEAAPPPAPPKQEVLLEEIRDLLKTNR